MADEDPPQPTAAATPANRIRPIHAVNHAPRPAIFLRINRRGRRRNGRITNAEVDPGRVSENTTVIW